MAKLTLSPIGSFSQSTITTINQNMDDIEAALENTLSRDGTTPNQMTADLDMNNNDIINVDNLDANNIVLNGQTLLTNPVSSTNAAALLALIKTVDGSGSGLDTDLVRGTTPSSTGLSILGAASVDDVQNLLDDVVYVATRTALKAIDTTKVTTCYLQEANRTGIFLWTAGNFSSQITADTTEGIYVKANAIASTAGAWVRQFVGLADVRWFGAALDDTTNDTTAFNNALSIATNGVLFPVGRAYITDMITVPNNKQLIGVGVAQSVFSIKADFNMSAVGVVKMGTSENQGLIDKIGFEFVQPATGNRAAMTQYPYAIYHNAIPRVRIGHIRISRGWNGIDARGNSGGSTYDWIECGTLNIGLYIDGALDTMNIGRFRVWPFGIGASGDGGTGDVYRDGTTLAARIGRCDGLAGQIQSFRAEVFFDANGVGSAPRNLTALHLDGDGARLKVYDGPLSVDFLYTTKTSSATGDSILLDNTGSNNPVVYIDSIYMKSSEPVVGILVNKGSLTINSGLIDYRDLTHEAALVQDGLLTIRNTTLFALGVRTIAYVRSTAVGATLNVQNCDFPNNAGTGNAIHVTANAPGIISGNVYNGRPVVNASTVNECDIAQAFTPVVAGTTLAGAGTYTTQQGMARKIGNKVDFQIRLDWTAHTGTGNMIVTGLPYTSNANIHVASVHASNLTFPGQLVAFVAASSTQITLQTFATGAAAAALAMDTAATLFITGWYFT